jgi:hypothetical protein
MQMMFPCHLPHHHPVKLEAPLEVEEEGEGAEEAIIIGLVTQMSHRFPHFPLAMTHMIVQVHQTLAITPEGVAYEVYDRYHPEVPQYTVVLYEDTALANNTKRNRAQ